MKALEEKKFKHGGFVIFQCHGYRNGNRRKRFESEFEVMLFNDILARTNKPEMLQKIGFIWIDDKGFLFLMFFLKHQLETLPIKSFPSCFFGLAMQLDPSSRANS